jgi:translation initiation factor IF-1
MIDNKEDSEIETTEGRIIEALPSTLFRVESSDKKVFISYLGGRMRVHKIKVLVGDKVLVQLDPYGGKGRIIKRL